MCSSCSTHSGCSACSSCSGCIAAAVPAVGAVHAAGAVHATQLPLPPQQVQWMCRGCSGCSRCSSAMPAAAAAPPAGTVPAVDVQGMQWVQQLQFWAAAAAASPRSPRAGRPPMTPGPVSNGAPGGPRGSSPSRRRCHGRGAPRGAVFPRRRVTAAALGPAIGAGLGAHGPRPPDGPEAGAMGAAGRSGALRLLAVLCGVLSAAGDGEPGAHSVAEVLFCQAAVPSLGLALTFDSDQLFWFDFPGSRWTPSLPDLPPWPPALEPPEQLLQDATLCQDLRSALSDALTGYIPEAKGIPAANVFPLEPPALGEPNTLVCMVENIFPPAVDITWQLNSVSVTRGVTHTHYTPTDQLTFVRFSYLPMTPSAGDVYSCVITRQAVQTPSQDEVLETALCGAAMALGIVLALLGIAMLLVARG
ncbi:class II histocompatibility antigen, M alpha chain isoform X2 [Colius striatus]|uniref:class II histocompatibility antigen, M alpha chain isoform X2 n=1 Tax=Colius striatus TaxID=57412 RepID=UPI002B1D9D0F|nr:class II histocompatibility antigen, M alpha chain isoform X2 [Colius striatus]